MGFFRRRKPAEVIPVVVKPSRHAGKVYKGDKKPIFREGFYYLCDIDSDGNELDPDVSVPLVWRDGGFHYAFPDEPNHFHTYGLAALELEPGSE